MAYKPTGRPVGRPKTKEYQTISLKIPQTLLDHVKRYARLHRQSLSELIRDGLEWRIGEGDPRGLGVSAPQATPGNENEYYGNTETIAEGEGHTEHTILLQEVCTTLARQEAQLKLLAQALEHHGIVPTPPEYFSNTQNETEGQPDQPEPAPEGHDSQRSQDIYEENSNTVLQNNIPVFDPTKYGLGTLCQKQHDYDGQGHSLRQRGGKHECVACKNARSRDYKQRQRQAKQQTAPA